MLRHEMLGKKKTNLKRIYLDRHACTHFYRDRKKGSCFEGCGILQLR